MPHIEQVKHEKRKQSDPGIDDKTKQVIGIQDCVEQSSGIAGRGQKSQNNKNDCQGHKYSTLQRIK